jgi:HAD superfamily hydrolase (TIGR01509 family)
MIRAVIYDMNGVLVDDEHLHFELFRDVLAESEGIALDEGDYLSKYLGFDDRGCFTAAITTAGRGLSSTRLQELIDQKARLYLDRAAEGLRLFPGAAASMNDLARSFHLAVCSGALRAEVELVLSLLGVRDLVQAVIAAEDTERCKPDPEGYLLVLDALRAHVGEDLEAAHCLVIEDSLAGIEAAKAAGMWAVGLEHTYPATELRSAGADAVLQDLTQLDRNAVVGLFTPEISP